jgi:hypothetical protein
MVQIILPVGLCVFGIGLVLVLLGLTGRVRYSEGVNRLITFLLLGGFIVVLINFIIIILRYLIIGN